MNLQKGKIIFKERSGRKKGKQNLRLKCSSMSHSGDEGNVVENEASEKPHSPVAEASQPLLPDDDIDKSNKKKKKEKKLKKKKGKRKTIDDFAEKEAEESEQDGEVTRKKSGKEEDDEKQKLPDAYVIDGFVVPDNEDDEEVDSEGGGEGGEKAEKKRRTEKRTAEEYELDDEDIELVRENSGLFQPPPQIEQEKRSFKRLKKKKTQAEEVNAAVLSAKLRAELFGDVGEG
jgi:hypothetical protein